MAQTLVEKDIFNVFVYLQIHLFEYTLHAYIMKTHYKAGFCFGVENFNLFDFVYVINYTEPTF